MTPATTTRGWLLLDIDGVLNPEPKRARRPDGYQTHRIPAPRYRRNGRRDLTVWYHPDHGRQLLELAQRTGLQLAWASQGWPPDQSNGLFGQWIGLPELPGIWFPRAEFDFLRWKFDRVTDFVGDTPFAWLDDDFRHAGRDAREQFDRTHTGRSLLLQVDPYHGLKQRHLDDVEAWAATLINERAS